MWFWEFLVVIHLQRLPAILNPISSHEGYDDAPQAGAVLQLARQRYANRREVPLHSNIALNQ
eukprot:1192306-Amphidinium_carterae.1